MDQSTSWTLSMVELHGTQFHDLLAPNNHSIIICQQRLQGQRQQSIASCKAHYVPNTCCLDMKPTQSMMNIDSWMKSYCKACSDHG